jgi:sugar/nucleoside kinase (ribokinase family)
MAAEQSDCTIDIIAFGSCYVDMNVPGFPIGTDGIPNESEIVGGRYELTAGGSAVNFCRTMEAAGVHSTFIGMAGADPMGDMLHALMQQSGISPHLVRRDDLQTMISFNPTSNEGGHIMQVAGSATEALGPETVLPALREIIIDAKLLYIGGAFKLRSMHAAYGEIADACDESGTAIVLDHGRVHSSTDEATTDTIRNLALRSRYYLPSGQEFMTLWDVDSIEAGLRKVSKLSAQTKTVVKDGSNGAYFLQEDEIINIRPSRVETVTNATGAGDNFNAGYIAAILHGNTTEAAVSHGCAVAAAHITGRPAPELQ